MAKGPHAKSDARSLFQRLKREELFRLAQLRNGECDAERTRAIRLLLRYSHLLTHARKVDWQLEDLIKGLHQRCLNSNDPVRAWEQLTARKSRPGPKVRNDDRDFNIAVSVRRYMLHGKSLEKATALNAELEGISETRIKKIYFAQLAKWTEAGLKAEVAFIESAAAESWRQTLNLQKVKPPNLPRK
jgi:hypothetical protein